MFSLSTSDFMTMMWIIGGAGLIASFSSRVSKVMMLLFLLSAITLIIGGIGAFTSPETWSDIFVWIVGGTDWFAAFGTVIGSSGLLLSVIGIGILISNNSGFPESKKYGRLYLGIGILLIVITTILRQ